MRINLNRSKIALPILAIFIVLLIVLLPIGPASGFIIWVIQFENELYVVGASNSGWVTGP